MPVRKISDRVYNVGAIDWERTLFDEIVPTPQGTSYNSYLVKGSEKTVLIDTVEPERVDELLLNLRDLGVERIDYIVSNHAEQDHSGSIPMLLERYPDAKVVTNAKCKGFEEDLLHLKDDVFLVINEGDELSLGDRTLKFYMTPWVHWPETMTTFLVEERIAFTCDFFGSHAATTHTFAEQYDRIYHEAKRYYAEIMMPFRHIIARNIKKIEDLDPKIIAPSHGPAYSDPKFIIDAYKEWISPETKNEVLIGYVSMHGSTKLMVNYLAHQLNKLGVEVKIRNLITVDMGEFAMDMVDVTTIVLATPTMLSGPHPNAVYAAYLINALKPKAKFIGIMGSYGWGGRTVDILKANLGALKVELLDPLLIKGLPKEEDYEKIDEFAKNIAEKHRELGVLK
ncbi:putative flavoprotein [Aciduliprofundum sp. MAR08-339]|uniref:FprA family A-type flavoprotein n=1 Tax=Aciduliprofundum sp. (strain MAR08-339) TaxID=673860 RepID=UPI0002A4ADB1|nr:putative flavoprotein [Aciduliprofundum sp. MAR08-339]